MSFSRLLKDRKIHREPAVTGHVDEQLAAARRDIGTARKLGPEDEWTFNIAYNAYNAMLLAGRAVMFSQGYRPTTGEGGHVAVIDFLRIHLGPAFAEIIDVMDRMRRQRHRIAYDVTGSVSTAQIDAALQIAEDFVSRIERLLRQP